MGMPFIVRTKKGGAKIKPRDSVVDRKCSFNTWYSQKPKTAGVTDTFRRLLAACTSMGMEDPVKRGKKSQSELWDIGGEEGSFFAFFNYSL